MTKKSIIAVILMGVAVLLGGAVVVRRWKVSSSSASAKGVAGTAGGETQTVTLFQVEKTTFSDSIDGLVGTVKGDTIELAYYGPEEPLTAIHVKVGQRVKKGDLLFELDHLRAESRKNQAETAYERAQELHAAGASTAMDMKESRSAYDIARRDYEDTFVRAPKDGYVSDIGRQVGEIVGRDKSDPLGVLVSSQDKLFLETGVIESQLDRVAQGQTVMVAIEALGLADVSGTVVGVSREVTTTGRTGTVHVGLPAEVQAKLRPGLSAQCKILTYNGNALLIPRQAYDVDAGGVYVVRDNKARLTKVELGYKTPDYYEVSAGLAGGDLIVRDLIINPVQDDTSVVVSGDPEKYGG